MRPFRAAQLRPSYSGYSASSASKEQELERQFDEQLNTADLKAWLKQLSSAPNQVGSPHDKANAEFIFSKFKEWGWDAHIETFEVLYPTPKKESLQLIAPHAYTAVLREPPIRGDSTSSQTKGVLPPYAAYGADDNVTADLVYVNYGMPDDYDDLKRLGIDVKGKIVIARYGDGWRGLKPRLAQEHGAVGCIIYSDPWDDGYREGDRFNRMGRNPCRRIAKESSPIRQFRYQRSRIFKRGRKPCASAAGERSRFQDQRSRNERHDPGTLASQVDD